MQKFHTEIDFQGNQSSNFGIKPVPAASGFPSGATGGAFHVKDIGSGVVGFYLYTGNSNVGDNGWIEVTQLTAAQVKSLYESNDETNAFTDTLLTKLNGIEAGAQTNLTATEIKTALFALSDTNNLTDTLLTKLNNLDEAGEANAVDSVNGQTGEVVLDADDIGLGNVTNDAQIPLTQKGAANGVASLDGSGTIPLAQLPDAAKRQTKVVADITERDALAGSELWEGRIITVLDASADNTVGSGSAGYIVMSDDSFEKIYEFESMDLDTSVFFNKSTETTDDITEGDAKFVTDAQLVKINAIVEAFTSAEKTKLAAISGTNTGDEADASDTVKGIVELATTAETELVTDSERAVTPAALVNNTWGKVFDFAGDGTETSFDITHGFDAETVQINAKIKNNSTGVMTKAYPSETYPSSTLLTLGVTPAPAVGETLIVSVSGKNKAAGETINIRSVDDIGVTQANNSFQPAEVIFLVKVGNNETPYAVNGTIDTYSVSTNDAGTPHIVSIGVGRVGGTEGLQDGNYGDAYYAAKPYTVNWGDGNTTSVTSGNEASLIHTYAAQGTYIITVSQTGEADITAKVTTD